MPEVCKRSAKGSRCPARSVRGRAGRAKRLASLWRRRDGQRAMRFFDGRPGRWKSATAENAVGVAHNAQ